jgi:mRNA-degrading endonuclease YafQ of YafQ-DinJ toxin-antitoxin module
MEISFSKSFRLSFKKRIGKNKLLEKKFWSKTELFLSNPFHPKLKTHKLSGELKDAWSFSVDYDCRVLFYFATTTKAVFVDVGTHDEVY